MSVVFDYENLEIKAKSVYSHHTNSVDAVKCSPNEANKFASGSHDKTICLWDIERPSPISTFSAHEEGIWSMDWSHDGKVIISTGPAGKVYITDAATGKTEHVTKTSLQKGYCVRFIPGTKEYLICGQNGAVEKHTIGNDNPINTFALPNEIAYDINLTPGQKGVMVSTGSGTIISLNNDLSHIKTYELSKHEIRTFAFMNNHLLTGFQNGNLKVFNLDETTVALKPDFDIKAHRADISTILYSPKYDLLLTGSKESSVFAWKGTNFRAIHNLVGHKDLISEIAINSTGTTIVTASWDQTLRAYNRADISG